MIRFVKSACVVVLLGVLLAPFAAMAQRVVVPTPGPAGGITPIVIQPAPPLTTQRIIIYQPPTSPELKLIVVPPPPPPTAHETPHVHIEHCEKSCLNQCSLDELSCKQLCGPSCK